MTENEKNPGPPSVYAKEPVSATRRAALAGAGVAGVALAAFGAAATYNAAEHKESIPTSLTGKDAVPFYGEHQIGRAHV